MLIMNKSGNPPSIDGSTKNRQVNETFKYQLDILKWELEYIQSGIRQMDEITTSIKNWAIVLWSGSIGIAIGSDVLRSYVGFTFLIPILFWLVDARWRKTQRGFIYRMNQIRDFLNSDDFSKSFEQQKVVNFTILDPRSKKSQKSDYKSYTSIRLVFFGSMAWLYLGLTIFSLAIHIIVG